MVIQESPILLRVASRRPGDALTAQIDESTVNGRRLSVCYSSPTCEGVLSCQSDGPTWSSRRTDRVATGSTALIIDAKAKHSAHDRDVSTCGQEA
eukprot:7427465-Pyramimonas_sp.AAC.1